MLFFQHSVIIFDNFTVVGDKTVGTLVITPYNDYVHSTSVSWVLETFVVFETTVFDYKVTKAADENDKEFTAVIYKSTMDLTKLVKGIRGSMLTKLFAGMVLTSDIKFPLPKVKFVNFQSS